MKLTLIKIQAITLVGSAKGTSDLKAGLWEQEQLRERHFCMVQGLLVEGVVGWCSQSRVASCKEHQTGIIMALVCGLRPKSSNYQLRRHEHLEALEHSGQKLSL